MWKKVNRHVDTTVSAKSSHSLPTDPATGAELAPKSQPGYYPGFSTLRQQAYWDAATRAAVLQRLEPPAPYRFFTEEEQSTWLAVLARLLPQEDRTLDRRIPILPGIDARLAENRIDGYRYEDMPADQEAYRIAGEAFEAMAREVHGKLFAQLTVPEQEHLMESVRAGKPAAADAVWRRLNPQRFWSILTADAVGNYYAHPWAWDEIGFGGPAYPRGYMRLEHGQPEPWESDEQRYAWKAPADSISDSPAARDK